MLAQHRRGARAGDLLRERAQVVAGDQQRRRGSGRPRSAALRSRCRPCRPSGRRRAPDRGPAHGPSAARWRRPSDSPTTTKPGVPATMLFAVSRNGGLIVDGEDADGTRRHAVNPLPARAARQWGAPANAGDTGARMPTPARRIPSSNADPHRARGGQPDRARGPTPAARERIRGCRSSPSSGDIDSLRDACDTRAARRRHHGHPDAADAHRRGHPPRDRVARAPPGHRRRRARASSRTRSTP